MRAFEYASPTAKEQAVSLLSGDAAPFAGGTDLLALMKDDIVSPKRLVNLKSIAALEGVAFSPRNGLRAGATVRLQEFADHADVRQHYPALAMAADDAASPQIRNMATLGGNICQRPRCWYFRNGFGLLPKSAEGKSLILEGDNRFHAILGNDGPAYFVSPSSVVPALIAYGARIRLFGSGGARELPLGAFFVVPQSENEREHDLKPGEIVTDILIPPPAPGVHAAHYEVRQKETFDWPLATASVALVMSGKTVKSARIVMGHVAPIPWISEDAAKALVGKEVTAETAAAAGDAAVTGAKSLGRNEYKIQLARVAVKRAILRAAHPAQPAAAAHRAAAQPGAKS